VHAQIASHGKPRSVLSLALLLAITAQSHHSRDFSTFCCLLFLPDAHYQHAIVPPIDLAVAVALAARYRVTVAGWAPLAPDGHVVCIVRGKRCHGVGSSPVVLIVGSSVARRAG